jgi:hypothetical protein
LALKTKHPDHEKQYRTNNYPLNPRRNRSVGTASSALLRPVRDITNAAGTVSFRLNENADNVKSFPAVVPSNDLGWRERIDRHKPWYRGRSHQSHGHPLGALGYTQITSDGNTNNDGIYVNKLSRRVLS